MNSLTDLMGKRFRLVFKRVIMSFIFNIFSCIFEMLNKLEKKKYGRNEYFSKLAKSIILHPSWNWT